MANGLDEHLREEQPVARKWKVRPSGLGMRQTPDSGGASTGDIPRVKKTGPASYEQASTPLKFAEQAKVVRQARRRAGGGEGRRLLPDVLSEARAEPVAPAAPAAPVAEVAQQAAQQQAGGAPVTAIDPGAQIQGGQATLQAGGALAAGLPPGVLRTGKPGQSGTSYSNAPGEPGGQAVAGGGNFYGARTDAEAVQQNPAMFSRLSPTGQGMGLTDSYNRQAEQMRAERLAKRDEVQQRRLLQAATTTPDAQYYNLSTEGGTYAALAGRQQAAQAALQQTGQERIAGQQLQAQAEQSGRREAQQDRSFGLQERESANREELQVRAARQQALRNQLDADKSAGTLTEAGKAYLKVVENRLSLVGPNPDPEMVNEARNAGLLQAGLTAEAQGLYLDPDTLKYIKPEDVPALAKKAKLSEAEFIKTLLGGPRG